MPGRILCTSTINHHGTKAGELASWPDTDETWRMVSGAILVYVSDDDPDPEPVATAVDTPAIDGAFFGGWSHGAGT